MRPLKVWDLPVRLFHWAIVLLIFAAWLSQALDQMDLHMWIGRTILSLLLFRIVWGLIGSDTARFSRFLRSPAAAMRHLAQIRRREADREIGHNAAGGWMVLVLLALLCVQVGTGLCGNDEISVQGPLAEAKGPLTMNIPIEAIPVPLYEDGQGGLESTAVCPFSPAYFLVSTCIHAGTYLL